MSEKRTSPTPTDGQIPGDECMVTVNLCKSRMLELIYVNLVCFESNTLLSTSYSKTTKQHVQKVQVGIVYQETSYVCVFCIKCYVQPSFLLAHPLQNHKKKTYSTIFTSSFERLTRLDLQKSHDNWSFLWFMAPHVCPNSAFFWPSSLQRSVSSGKSTEVAKSMSHTAS